MRASSLVGFVAPLAFLLGSPALQAQRFGNPDVLAPDFPTPEVVIERMLTLAQLKPGETLYDLGSGEGRILITAARKFKAKAVGIELSPELCKAAMVHVKALRLEDQIRIIHGNLLKVDLSPADVVTIYLLTASNDLLRPNLERDLKPGARVVSHDYQIRGWKPSVVEKVEAEGRARTIYVYEIGPKK
ncbi:MAG: class I SAM-dependent methyltransferase [Acidobacteriia bacterium]|nr:class I SAM-dependent methyltransferase [Terriglobia bacterium]